jgi:hypothetical protein
MPNLLLETSFDVVIILIVARLRAIIIQALLGPKIWG